MRKGLMCEGLPLSIKTRNQVYVSTGNLPADIPDYT